jgi:transposase
MRARPSERPRDWREGRRLRAVELHAQGWRGKEIAAALGVSAGAVSQWCSRARVGGREALRSHPPPGPTPKLTAEQRAALPGVLAKGAEAYDFVGDVWTTKRIAAVIRRVFGVTYHPAHVSRLMRQLGWTVQKPVLRATQRDEAKVAAWRDQQWPALQAKRKPKVAR